jgi:hypothetical protein
MTDAERATIRDRRIAEVVAQPRFEFARAPENG